MKKIAIVENDYNNMRHSFEYVRDKYFHGQIEFEPILSVNKKTDFDSIAKADLILVDILLGEGSEYDGYDVLKKLTDYEGAIDRSRIITGHSLIDDNLAERGLPEIPYFVKPLRIDGLKEMFSELVGLEKKQ